MELIDSKTDARISIMVSHNLLILRINPYTNKIVQEMKNAY